MSILMTFLLFAPLHADEFDDLHARLAHPPVTHDVLEAAMTRALDFELICCDRENPEFIGLRWALAPALRDFLAETSVETRDDLRRLGKAIALAERLRILDDATFEAVRRFHFGNISRWTRLVRPRWAKDYEAVKEISLEALRTMSSLRDRARIELFADPTWNERMSEPCAMKLLRLRREENG